LRKSVILFLGSEELVAKKKKKRRLKPHKKVFVPTEETDSSPTIHPKATLTPDASLEEQTTWLSLSADSTNAPTIGEDVEDSEAYASSSAALLDKYVLSRLGKEVIPFILVVGIIGYIVIQDNGAGRISNFEQLIWTVKKCGIVLLLLLCPLVIRALFSKFFQK